MPCVMPTGGGKSLCYQLPSLVRPGLTIVVSPLIALMKDQVDGLQKRGIRATLINSSLSPQEQNERLEQVSSGRFSMLYVAPERLRNQRFLDSIRATPIQLLAIDEAHCISEWGHDFRPDYQRLGRFREALGNVQTIALTATATPRVRADILKSLQLESSRTFITGFARDNLHFGSVQCMSDREKDRQLHQFLDGRNESGIIYVATRKRCEALVDQLAKELKLNVGAYHAGLLPEQRKLIQDKFMAGELKAIVATNAFGMGIDKSDLRYVVHYNMPGTLEAYYQEAGRAGRDGLQSQCVLLYSTQDRYIQEFFIENANPSRELMQSVYEFLAERPEDPIELTADEIREQIGQSASSEAINSALQILGRTDVLERLEVAGGLAMFRLSSRMPSFVDLLPRDASVRRTVMRTVEKAIGDRRDEAVYIHPRWMMEQLQMDRDTMSRHLRELCKLEDFEYVPPFRGRAIHFRKRNVHFDDLKIDHAALAARKKADYEKLDQMVAYARSQKCRQLTILEYFGDKSATECKLCDRCQGRSGWPRMPKTQGTTNSTSSDPSLPTQKGKKSKAGKRVATTNELDVVPLTTATSEPIEEPISNVIVVTPPTRPLPTNPQNTPDKKNNGVDPNTREAKLHQPTRDPFSDESVTSDSEETRAAVQCIQTVLGAIERTHGYLSKTVLTQHFSGTESKAVSGLRLQRLPEFGILRDWKKSHASGLIDAMLDHG
ncbi:MAG: RecQ family ATP-dependent DNA helicase, partial [Planctomycetes bacterium]|nr:RecQ family ATP-dependent DNA helicase [Planctomycetota bacterium]